MKKDITSKKDIDTLVTTFYSRIRKDVYLGAIFEKHIHDWPAHLEHISTFWENSLFRTGQYHGNPLEVHEKVDKEEGHRIDEHHFGALVKWQLIFIYICFKLEKTYKFCYLPRLY